MKRIKINGNYILTILCLVTSMLSYAGAPVWTFTPITATTLTVASNDTATVQYIVTNKSNRIHTLSMQSIQGVAQNTSGLGVCGNPFVLKANASCTLSLQVNGSQLSTPVNDGPIVCEQGSKFQCYRPASNAILHITQTSANTEATLTVTGSPLTLTTKGSSGTLTINNTSSDITATNITSDFTGTALEGNVTETGNTCSSVAPLSSCTLTYTPGDTAVSLTNFSIQGSNTYSATAAIEIDSDFIINTVSPSSGPTSGGTGVTVTGKGFTGATSLKFGGTNATSLNVVSSTVVTAVTPAHAAGAVDVVITTSEGSATKTNGFTYETTAVGQSAYGGTVACLNGNLNNLIAATADNSSEISWGGFGETTNATSTTDGAANTTIIVSTLGTSSSYAARTCSEYEVDSQGNSPCESGNTCYNDWFLPAGNNLDSSGQLNCLYNNRTIIGGFSTSDYWSSTEASSANAWIQSFDNGTQSAENKDHNPGYALRCVRAFNP